MASNQVGARRDQQRSVQELADLVKNMIKVVGLLFGAAFGYLQLKDTPLNRIGEVFDGDSIIIVALCLYYSGWVIGAGADTKIQESALGVDPKLAKLGALEWLAILLFTILLFAVFAFHSYPILFQCLLTAFVCTNVWTWRIILRRTRPMIEASADAARAGRNNYAYLKLQLMTDYMNGTWQRRRFVTLAIFAALQIPVAMLDDIGRLRSLIGNFTFAGISGDALSDYATGILFLIWVILSELWMKVYRVKILSDVKTLDFMSDHLELHRLNRGDLPPLNFRRTFDFTKADNRNYC